VEAVDVVERDREDDRDDKGQRDVFDRRAPRGRAGVGWPAQGPA
jgi:hypothetical protein